MEFWRIQILFKPVLLPINESISGVNLDKLWVTLRRYINGTEALYSGADYRISAAGSVNGVGGTAGGCDKRS